MNIKCFRMRIWQTTNKFTKIKAASPGQWNTFNWFNYETAPHLQLQNISIRTISWLKVSFVTGLYVRRHILQHLKLMYTHLSQRWMRHKTPCDWLWRWTEYSFKIFILVCQALIEQASFPVSLLEDICIPTKKLEESATQQQSQIH